MYIHSHPYSSLQFKSSQHELQSFRACIIQSAQGLKFVNHPKKLKPYAVVFIRDHNNILHSSERKTSVDSECGSNPTWDFNVKFTINLAIAQENHLDLVVKLKSRRKTHGLRDKDIGEVRVLISELLKCLGDDDDDDDDATEDEKHMSKSIVTSDGEAQGALAFSYKFGRTVDHRPTDPNMKQRPKRGANGFAGQFFEGLGKGLGSGLMDAVTEVGNAFYDDDDDDQPDDDNDNDDDDDDDNEDEYS